MLVLARKRGECIVIGSNIEVTVLDVRGNKVRIGFAASPDIAIHRAEVYHRVQDNDPPEPKVPIDTTKPNGIALKKTNPRKNR